MTQNAVSLYNQDQQEDFPVLKAFQQYIDAEQNKARRRMLALSIFFGCLMTVMIVFFLYTLNNLNTHNQEIINAANASKQELNDRLIAMAMNHDREQPQQASVVVHAPPDNSAVLTLTQKLEESQKKFEEAQRRIDELQRKAKEEQAAADIAKAEEDKKARESEEVQKLRAQLAAEKARYQEEKRKRAEEKRKQAEEEIKAQRLRLYGERELKARNPQPVAPPPPPSPVPAVEDDEDDDEIDRLLSEIGPDLFKDDEEEDEDDEEDEEITPPASREQIPVNVKGSPIKYRIPKN